MCQKNTLKEWNYNTSNNQSNLNRKIPDQIDILFKYIQIESQCNLNHKRLVKLLLYPNISNVKLVVEQLRSREKNEDIITNIINGQLEESSFTILYILG